MKSKYTLRGTTICFSVVSFLATLLLGGFLPTALFATSHADAAAALASAGWKAFEEGEFANAKLSLERAIRLEPGQADYYQALAEIDFKLGDEVAAIKHFTKAIRLRPSDRELRLRVAHIYQAANNDVDALRILHASTPEGSVNDAWHFTRGFSLFRIGRFEPAQKEFELVSKNPQFEAPANFFLGSVAFAQNHFDAAALYFAVAVKQGNLESNKAYNAYTYDYGLTLFQLGQFKAAEKQFRASLERYPDDPLPWMFLGRCEQELGNFQSAIELLETSIKVAPDFQLSYYELARLQQKHGDQRRAEELFEKVSKMKAEEISRERDRAMKLRTGIGQQ